MFQLRTYEGNQSTTLYAGNTYFGESYLLIDQKVDGDHVAETYTLLRTAIVNPAAQFQLTYSHEDYYHSSENFQVFMYKRGQKTSVWCSLNR